MFKNEKKAPTRREWDWKIHSERSRLECKKDLSKESKLYVRIVINVWFIAFACIIQATNEKDSNMSILSFHLWSDTWVLSKKTWYQTVHTPPHRTSHSVEPNVHWNYRYTCISCFYEQMILRIKNVAKKCVLLVINVKSFCRSKVSWTFIYCTVTGSVLLIRLVVFKPLFLTIIYKYLTTLYCLYLLCKATLSGVDIRRRSVKVWA